MKISALIPILLLGVGAQADGFKFPESPKHLLPLDGRGIDLYDGYARFLQTVSPRHDYPISSIYIWPASKPGVLITIYQTEDESSYYFEYALDTKPTPTVTKMPLHSDVAKDLSSKLAKIIATDTRYPSDGRMPILCTDGTEYVFQSADVYGRAMCPAEGNAAQLEQFADRIVDLAESKTTEQVFNQRLSELASTLDAIRD